MRVTAAACEAGVRAGRKYGMDRTAVNLGGVAIGSSVMNASGPRSAERGELYELCAVHTGPLVFKSCNAAGLEEPENLKNKGVEHFAAIARELGPRGKILAASVIGASDGELVSVARMLDRAGVNIIELNLADDYVQRALAPFASIERLGSLIRPVREATAAVLAVKLPQKGLSIEPRRMAELMKSLGVAILVCANDLPKDLDIDIASATVAGEPRSLSQVHAFYRETAGMLDIVAVGGVNTGRDAYIAHLTGAKAVQVGSALIKEGAGALGRIDRELDALLAENGKRSVSEIIGAVRFSG